MKKLIHEIHRRSLWQVLGIYLAGSWIAFQAVQTLTEGLGLPDWVPPLALVALIVGLPVVIATAFVQEGIGAPAAEAEGVVGASRADDQPAAEASPDPVAAAPSGVSAARAAPDGVHHRLFTWRNAILGGVGAFALVGLVAGGYMAMRTLGIGPAGTLVAKGVLDERATILVSDFSSSDSLLARAATEAMRIDLSQSAIVRLAEPAFVGEALARMGRSDETLDRETARELAVREGVPAVLAGEINPAGGRYLLSAELVAAADGQVLASHREIASDSTAILDAIDALSKHIRERIGESLRTIRAEPPLERATTPSLEALRKYSLAIHAVDVRGQEARGIALLEEAIGLDPSFAMAHRKIGMMLRNRGEERARMVEAMTRAWENLDRLTERERYLATAAYHEAVTGDVPLAIAAYQNLLAVDPEHHAATNNLGVMYEIRRDFRRAEEMYEAGIRADSASHHSYTNMISARFNQGDSAGARAALETAVSRFPQNPSTNWYRHHLSAVMGDYERADSLAEMFVEEQGPELYWRAVALGDRAVIAMARGRAEAARTHLGAARIANEERRLPAEILGNALMEAWLDLILLENPSRAAQTLERALADHPLDAIDPVERPYLPLASAFAIAGAPDRARRLIDEFEEQVPKELHRELLTTMYLHRARAAVALAEGDRDEAIEQYRLSDRGACNVCAFWGLATAHEASGDRDAAIEALEALVDTPEMYRFVGTFNPELAPTAGPALEWLARLYDEAGDLEKAAEHYARFVELWADADEVLQARVRAAQTRLEEIARQRG